MSELIIDKITTRDGSSVGAIVVADIDELLLLNTNKEINTTAIVKDSNRGGVFVYDATQSGVNNGGTIFNGWVRQYDGAVNVKWFGAKEDSAFDSTTAITNALAVDNNVVLDGNFYVDGLDLDIERNAIRGLDTASSSLSQISTAVNDYTVKLNARLTTIENIAVYANSSSKCIYVAYGQLGRINNVVTKFGLYGIYLESCNSISIQQFFAGSCFKGIQTAPVTSGNLNGMRIEGRSYNCEYGFVVQNPNVADRLMMHSTIIYSTEGNTIGWYEDTSGIECRYNHIDLYSESNNRTSTASPANTNEDFVMAGSPNYYFIKNPTNVGSDELFKGKSVGWFTSGGAISPRGPFSGNKATVKAITYSQSLYLEGDNVVFLSNTSGATRNLTLAFVASMPIGSEVKLVSNCTSYGLNLLPPSGYTWNQASMNVGAYSPTTAPYTTLIVKDTATSFQAIRLN